MSEKVDTGLQSITHVRVGLVSDNCGAKEKLDADAMICALAAENTALRAENLLMAKSLDAEELRVGLSTTGGMWRFWRDKAAVAVSENDALRDELKQMRSALENALSHHYAASVIVRGQFGPLYSEMASEMEEACRRWEIVLDRVRIRGAK